MGLQDVGVRLVAEGEAQFTATLNRAGNAVESFGKNATKAGTKGMTGLSKSMDSTRSKIGKSIDSIKGKFSELNASLSGQRGPEAMRIAWGGLIGTAGIVVGALSAVGSTVKKLADDYMAYAFQVKDFGRIIGATPEEASRLIQVADDVRLSVGSMQIAMRTAINKGYRPTIEGLGQMSDAYLAIQDPIERSKWLIETFGRSGLEMAKLMELGSTKIKTMSDSIDAGLIVTQKGIDQATQYYQELDKLNDRWTALQRTAGVVILPIVIEGLEQVLPAIDKVAEFISMAVKYETAMRGLRGELQETNPDVLRLLQLQADLAEVEGDTTAQDQATQAIYRYRLAALGVAGVTTDLAKANTGLSYSNDIAVASEEDLALALSDTDTAASRAAVSISDVTRKAQQIANAQKVQIGLDFTLPNISDKMKNLIKSIDWKAAGGDSLTTFMEGFAEKAATLGPDAQKEVAKQVGAVDIALEVKTGEVTKSEGIQQLMDLADIDYTAAKTQIDAIMKLEPTDIGPYLENIMKLAEPEGSTATAAESTKVLDEKVKGLGMSMQEEGGKIITWNDNLVMMEEYSRAAYAAVRDLSGALKSLPTAVNIPVTVGGGAPPKTTTTNTSSTYSAFCFIAGTPILIESGNKSIENIEIGDRVWSYNEIECKSELKRVVAKSNAKRRRVGILKTNSGTVVCSDNHRFYTNSQWIEARDLSTNSEILTIAGFATVRSFSYLEGEYQVYNFEVEDNHNYFANGLLAHNGKAAGGPVSNSTVYWVGERGPELFVPDANGTIVPNNKSMSLLNKVMSIIPMAKGGKVTKEKAHMQALKKSWEQRGYRPFEEGGGGEEGESGENPLERQGQEAVSKLQAREDYAWSALKTSVAEYNYLIRQGASKAELAKRKADIDQQAREAQALTKLRTEAEKQMLLLDAGTTEGFEQISVWMRGLIGQFQEFFNLLTSPVAKNAMNVIDPLTAHSPAPLALGLEQIKKQVGQVNLGDLFGNVAQLAGSGGFGGATYSSVYNINVPISAQVGGQADIKVLAYQVAKEIAANVRY